MVVDAQVLVYRRSEDVLDLDQHNGQFFGQVVFVQFVIATVILGARLPVACRLRMYQKFLLFVERDLLIDQLNLIRLVRSQFGKEIGYRARLNQREFINGFIHSIVYGAKLDTDFDVRILKSLVNNWLNNESSPAAEYADRAQLNAETEIKLLGLAPNIGKWQASIQSHLIKQKLLLLTSQLNADGHQEFDRLVKLVQDLQLSRYLQALAGRRPEEPSNSIQVAIAIQARQAQRLGELILRCLEQPHKQDLLKLAKNETPDHWLTSRAFDREIKSLERAE